MNYKSIYSDELRSSETSLKHFLPSRPESRMEFSSVAWRNEVFGTTRNQFIQQLTLISHFSRWRRNFSHDESNSTSEKRQRTAFFRVESWSSFDMLSPSEWNEMKCCDNILCDLSVMITQFYELKLAVITSRLANEITIHKTTRSKHFLILLLSRNSHEFKRWP